jgi:biotin carboxyl carrier protein
VIEAMKMETRVVAPVDGVVDAIPAPPGTTVRPGDAIVSVRPSGAGNVA